MTKNILLTEIMENSVGEKQKKLYRDAAKKAIENSKELLTEAKLLYGNNHYARAFSLCVLSLEEFTKAFMYRCVSTEILEEQGFQKVIGSHHLKIQTSAHLIRWAILLMDHLDDLAKVIEEDKKHKDHSKHKYPNTLDGITTDSAIKSIETLYGGSDAKNMSVYVEIREGKIISPQDVIDKDRCGKAITNTAKVLDAHSGLLLGEDDFFKTCADKYLNLLIRDIQLEIDKRIKK